MESDSGISLRLMATESEERDGGVVVHLFGRDAQQQRHHVIVHGHKPSFFIHEDEYTHRTENHPAVVGAEAGYESIRGEPLVKIYTRQPSDVPEVRKAYERTWEADVWFDNRFLIDTGIYTGFQFEPEDATSRGDCDHYIHVDDIEPCEPPDIEPRTITLDIEVGSDAGFPEPEVADWPIISIVAHDSYEQRMVGWLLHDDSCEWSASSPPTEEGTGLDDLRVYTDEQDLLSDFCWWVEEREPDIMTGWNSSGFDLPYIMNRARNLDVWAVRDLSPMEQTFTTRRGDPVAKGVALVDMLEGYRKTQIHKLQKHTLQYVAQEEGVAEKLEMAHTFIDAWREKPASLMEYNMRDVRAVVEIEQSQEVIDLLESLRDVTGAQLTDTVSGNFDMMDVMMLREATDRGIRLPTSEQPDEDWYHGAWVAEPKAGLHEHSVYPDLQSLYPSLMAMCNMSPETIVGTQADLFMSEYEEQDCHWSYIDPRPVKRVERGEEYQQYKRDEFKAIQRRTKSGGLETVWRSEPEYVRLYYLKPSVQEGFVSSVVGDILDMKDEYRGLDIYEAVKRVANSTYGVFGDSDTRGTGFRLFDWRIAESITLGGRKVIQFAAEEFLQDVNEYKVVGGFDGDDAIMVGGDTDAVVTSIPFATDREHAIEVAEVAAERTNDAFDNFALETFNVADHRLYLDVESYSERFFSPEDPKQADGVGKKKRYVSYITYEDGEPRDEPKMNIKGFEAVRSDVSQITVEAQEYIFEQLMTCDDLEEARERCNEYVHEVYEGAQEGEIDLSRLGIPFGIGQDLSEYGSPSRAAQPAYRGARYANKHIYGTDAIGEGDKPMYFYVTDTGRLPDTYESETNEDGREVDAISVFDAADIPAGVEIDVDHMLERSMEKPLKPIYETLGWRWDEAIWGRMSLAEFM